MVLLNEHQVREKCGNIGRTCLYYWRVKNNFPKPVHVADGSRNFWIEAQVDQWLEENIVTT